MLTWKDWLHETVSWGMDYMPRHKAIHHFVVHGLMPFIESNGYTLACSPRDLQVCIIIVESRVWNQTGVLRLKMWIM